MTLALHTRQDQSPSAAPTPLTAQPLAPRPQQELASNPHDPRIAKEAYAPGAMPKAAIATGISPTVGLTCQGAEAQPDVQSENVPRESLQRRRHRSRTSPWIPLSDERRAQTNPRRSSWSDGRPLRPRRTCRLLLGRRYRQNEGDRPDVGPASTVPSVALSHRSDGAARPGARRECDRPADFVRMSGNVALRRRGAQRSQLAK
jgi:hypothetical protein